MSESGSGTNRRRFFQYAAALGVGGQTLLKSRSLNAAVTDAKESIGAPWPEMQYRTLGRTEFEASRLVFGCGASLMRPPKDNLLNAAFDAGVNVFDVGTGRYYDMAERNMKQFLKNHGDEIFLISKSHPGHADGALYTQPGDSLTVEQARASAEGWLSVLEESLNDLGVEKVDAYYQMGANNTELLASEEMYRAFERARESGKVRFYGLSTHQNAAALLETAIETGWYDLAMIAITPGGWYDWESKNMLEGSPPMAEIRPLLDRAREAGIGLIGMKAVRYFSSGFFGTRNQKVFDGLYPQELLEAKMSAFQRSYAYVLENGLDCVNADIQNYDQLRENQLAAATSGQYFGNVA
jgi:aryl-alcohol dehydrogenase-like predicted oxidoreductase